MGSARKDWDQFVVNAEEIARSPGFLALKEEIVKLAASPRGAVVADIGSGTDLLALEMAPDAGTIWAIDISQRMSDYLAAKSLSAGFTNIQTVVASAVSLPLVDSSVDVVVSNYCFHHLSDADKERAISEVYRVLRPGGGFVFGDMMFRVSVSDSRDRTLLIAKLRAIASRGIPGMVRIAKNALKYLAGQWEAPARADWWQSALADGGFEDVRVRPLDHEGGIAVCARPPSRSAAQGDGRTTPGVAAVAPRG